MSPETFDEFLRRMESGAKPPKRYASTTCPECGRTIREGAWGSRDSNFRKHARAHERRRARDRAS